MTTSMLSVMVWFTKIEQILKAVKIHMSSTNYKSFLCNTDKIFACNFSDRQMAISLHGPLEEKKFSWVSRVSSSESEFHREWNLWVWVIYITTRLHFSALVWSLVGLQTMFPPIICPFIRLGLEELEMDRV